MNGPTGLATQSAATEPQRSHIMAKGVNKVILIGNLGRDPEIRHSAAGVAVGKLNLAISERKKEGDTWVDHTEWVRVTVFGKTAENAGEYLRKGRQVYVEGRMQTSSYSDKDGNEKWSTEVVANELNFLGGGREDQGPRDKGRGSGDEMPF